jgi:hypothetical protein
MFNLNSVKVNELKIPRISLDGSFLIPYSVKFPKGFFQNEHFVNEITNRVLNLIPGTNYTKPVIAGQNELALKVYKKLKELSEKKIFYLDDNLQISCIHYVVLVQPHFDKIDFLYREEPNQQICYEKQGLIPDLRRSEAKLRNLVSIYSDNLDVDIMPDFSVLSLITLDDLLSFNNINNFEWTKNKKHWTRDYLSNANEKTINSIIKEKDEKTSRFIKNYPSFLTEKKANNSFYFSQIQFV